MLLSLRTIVNTGFSGVSYDDARYDLDDTDRDPNNSSNVILLYTGASVSGVWDGGTTWNREHIWPQSLLGEDAGGINIASDLHNLKPANPSVNSSRSNKWFANTTTTVSYAPRDAVKGDIARILFYMVVMYDYLTLIETDSVEPVVHEMGDLSTITSWLTLDTVDDFERNRNETIFGIQYNRNPFIDYPDFYQMIYEV